MNALQTGRLFCLLAACLPWAAQARMSFYHAPAEAPSLASSEATGSHNAPKGRYPYAAFIRLSPSGWFCSGSLIAPDLVLTAAHCSYDESNKLWNASEMRVQIGLYNVSNPHDGREFHNVSLVLPHPDFDPSQVPGVSKRDIAVFRLATTSKKTPVALRQHHPNITEEAVLDLTPLELLGWGSTAQSRHKPIFPKVLEEAHQLYRSHSNECRDTQDDEICAWGVADKGVVAAQCGGDSGGPLIQAGNNATTDVQWGVTINGEEVCGADGQYSFTDVTEEGVKAFLDKALEDAAKQSGEGIGAIVDVGQDD